MIRYQNFPNYGLETFKNGSKTFSEFSIPVKVNADGTYQYIRSFGTLVLDETRFDMKLKKYGTEPFSVENLKDEQSFKIKFTKEPRYDVPPIFVKDMERLGYDTPEESLEMERD